MLQKGPKYQTELYLVIHTGHPHLLSVGDCEGYVLEILATLSHILGNPKRKESLDNVPI